MTRNKRLKITEAMLLVLIWVVILSSPVLFRQEETLGWLSLKGPVQTMVPLFILFLINRFILVPRLLFRKNYLAYFISVGAIIGIFSITLYLFPRGPQGHKSPREPNIEMEMHAPPPPQWNEPARGGPVAPFANFLIFSILLVGFDTGLRFSFKMADTEREKAKLEKENSETQLAFLRNQVSPHFFMNTLNNIHSLIDFDRDEAKESIIRLSKLMRHLLYDSEIEKIPIQKEMEFISNYIDLMKLRFSEKVQIMLTVPNNLPDKKIPPLLFTSFVENAFKHGISYKKGSFIRIDFAYTENKLDFHIENSISDQNSEDAPSGIGIQNARKRLELLYGEDYTLEIASKQDSFNVHLSIPL